MLTFGVFGILVDDENFLHACTEDNTFETDIVGIQVFGEFRICEQRYLDDMIALWHTLLL